MRLEFANYDVELGPEGFSVYLGGRRYAKLQPLSALDSLDAQDIGERPGQPEVRRDGDAVEFTWRTSSSLWEEKTCRWRFEPQSFRHSMTVKGAHTVDHLRFLDNASENVFGWSYYDFSRFFTPECALLDQRYYRSMQYGCIDGSSGPMSDYPRDPNANNHWIFTPPPLCYSLGFSSGPWLAAGLAPAQGEYNFSRFEYVPGPNSFCFRLTYDGMTRVDGEWTSPDLVFLPADDEYSGLSAYCDWLRERGLVNSNLHPRHESWSRPIFCGWGEQNVNAIRKRLPTGQMLATQEMYDQFLAIIREKRLQPGTIVIDDKWQKHYGACEVNTQKWPDLRGWIDARHAEGLRVVLWYGAWNREGLPDDELIRDPEGRPCCTDPTSPGYSARIREMMHRMMSADPGCYNADGIKYDWTNGLPVGRGYAIAGNTWGIELFKSLTQQVYDALKAAKPDALMITHTANPYFSECTDMIRLNDIAAGAREIGDMMAHRQRIGRIACPHALIDCDNSSSPGHTEWLEYTKMQPQLGVPSLYFLTGFDGTAELITDSDWDELAHIWRAQH